jgi:hypothetical protein
MKTEQGQVTVTTWWRDSTLEWIGQVDYAANATSGSARYTANTETEARNAAYCAIGKLLLETTFDT